ncbi:hypothetical protein GLYMA_06G053500v4 [Glycine max]|uniref:Uncharacterized protein n=1 Tax=Glycine max TaxID=3847 RepID=A0A0R0JIG6_SOYBN|nr:hypothetical protein GYH30_014153 [Glycine max]KRH52213.1 hypothetical protein GLYMA_06G053500v4 [Glycine max]
MDNDKNTPAEATKILLYHCCKDFGQCDLLLFICMLNNLNCMDYMMIVFFMMSKSVHEPRLLDPIARLSQSIDFL